mgnify:CR=1 FL=1
MLPAAARRVLDREIQQCRAAALVGLQVRGESALQGGREWAGALQGWSLGRGESLGSVSRAVSRRGSAPEEKDAAAEEVKTPLQIKSPRHGKGAIGFSLGMGGVMSPRSENAAGKSGFGADSGLRRTRPQDMFSESDVDSDEDDLQIPTAMPRLALPVPLVNKSTADQSESIGASESTNYGMASVSQAYPAVACAVRTSPIWWAEPLLFARDTVSRQVLAALMRRMRVGILVQARPDRARVAEWVSVTARSRRCIARLYLMWVYLRVKGINLVERMLSPPCRCTVWNDSITLTSFRT